MIVLADLEGAWRLCRTVEDLRAGVTGRLEGRSVWRPDGIGLRQQEDGVLRYGASPPMPARRVYLWRETDAGLAVHFDDGRPFHAIAAGRSTARHLCPPDTYDVTYAFGDWPRWRQTWRVTGPRKDAVVESRFAPA